MKYSEYLKEIKKVNQTRKHKFKNSIGIEDYYRYLKKLGIYNISQLLVSTIIKTINKYLVLELLKGNSIELPYRMGSIELRKYILTTKFENGKFKTNRPIDWNRTLELWYNDEESKRLKTLIYLEIQDIFKIYYNKSNCNYTNKSYMKFYPNRLLKICIKQLIQDKKIDAYNLY